MVPSRIGGLVSWQLSQLGAHAHRLVAEALAEHDARGYDVRVLAALDEGGATSQAELARRSGIHGSDLVAVLPPLVDAGWVRRDPDASDARRRTVAITSTGRDRLIDLLRALETVQERLQRAVPAADRDQFTALLAAVLADLEEA